MRRRVTIWSAGFLFTWVFDGLFQLARYPLGLYPGWTQLILTWVIPIGVMTTIPARTLIGTLSPLALLAFFVFAVLLVIGASLLFKFGLRRYTSASSQGYYFSLLRSVSLTGSFTQHDQRAITLFVRLLEIFSGNIWQRMVGNLFG